MKKLLLLMAFIMPMIFASSCSDDDDKVNIDSPIVGTWFARSYGIKDVVTFKNDGTVTSKTTYGDTTEEDHGTYELKATDDPNKGAVKIYWASGETVVMAFIISENTMTTSMEGETGITQWTRQ